MLLCLGLLAVFAVPQAASAGGVLIEGSSVHGVGPGQDLATAVAALRGCNLNLRGEAREGDEAVQIVVECDATLSAVIDWDIETGRVYRVNVRGGSAKTRQGVGVGDSVSRAIAAYGEPEIASGEGNVCAVFARAPGLSFCIDHDAAARYFEDPTPLATKSLAAGARIREILVGKPPEHEVRGD